MTVKNKSEIRLRKEFLRKMKRMQGKKKTGMEVLKGFFHWTCSIVTKDSYVRGYRGQGTVGNLLGIRREANQRGG